MPVRAVFFHTLLCLALEFAPRLVGRRHELAIGALVVQETIKGVDFFLGDQRGAYAPPTLRLGVVEITANRLGIVGNLAVADIHPIEQQVIGADFLERQARHADNGPVRIALVPFEKAHFTNLVEMASLGAQVIGALCAGRGHIREFAQRDCQFFLQSQS